VPTLSIKWAVNIGIALVTLTTVWALLPTAGPGDPTLSIPSELAYAIRVALHLNHWLAFLAAFIACAAANVSVRTAMLTITITKYAINAVMGNDD
jgi:hypothetical protein